MATAVGFPLLQPNTTLYIRPDGGGLIDKSLYVNIQTIAIFDQMAVAWVLTVYTLRTSHTL